MPVRKRKGKNSEEKAPPRRPDAEEEGEAEDVMIDLYGEPLQSSLVDKTRAITGAVLGNFVAELLFGAAESPYRVPADFSKFTDGSGSSDDSDDGGGEERVKARLARAKASATKVAAAVAPLPLRAGATPEPCEEPQTREMPVTVPRRLDAASALTFVEALHGLKASVVPVAPSSLAKAVQGLCAAHGGPAVVGRLAEACRSTAAALARVEYELKRAQWLDRPDDVDPQAPQPNVDDGAASRLVAALVDSAAAPSLGPSADAPAGASADAPAGAAASSLPSAAPAPAEEEVWVLDQLCQVLEHSGSSPDIFWRLLEERSLMLGHAAAPGGSASQEAGPWLTATYAAMGLAALGSAWAIPAVYQRAGSPFLLAAALALQLPTLALGATLWQDQRTSTIGATLTTIGASLTPLTVRRLLSLSLPMLRNSTAAASFLQGLAVQCVGASLGFFVPGAPRGWFPEPFALILNADAFPWNLPALAAGRYLWHFSWLQPPRAPLPICNLAHRGFNRCCLRHIARVVLLVLRGCRRALPGRPRGAGAAGAGPRAPHALPLAHRAPQPCRPRTRETRPQARS